MVVNVFFKSSYMYYGKGIYPSTSMCYYMYSLKVKLRNEWLSRIIIFCLPSIYQSIHMVHTGMDRPDTQYSKY